MNKFQLFCARILQHAPKIFFISILLALVGTFINNYTFSRSDRSEGVIISLNEPVWSEISTINQVTYNTFNSHQTAAAVVSTEEQEKLILRQCEDNVADLKAFTNEERKSFSEKYRLAYLRNLTCLHFQGALVGGENYWSLQGRDVFALTKEKLVDLIDGAGENYRAKIINGLDLSDITLTQLRKPEFYKTTAISKGQEISLYCSIFFKEYPQAVFFSQDFEFDQALNLATSEACQLFSYFYLENSKL